MQRAKVNRCTGQFTEGLKSQEDSWELMGIWQRLVTGFTEREQLDENDPQGRYLITVRKHGMAETPKASKAMET